MKKILFIEDEAAVQKTLGESLRKAGYEVQSALDGELGLALAKKGEADLILLDIMLPKLSGLEILERIKQDEKIKDIPVIILTNLENIAEVERAVELGAKTYLVKSNYGLEEVVEKIKKVLNGN